MRGHMIEARRNGAWHVTTPPAAVPSLDWPADLFSRKDATVVERGITGTVSTRSLNDLFLFDNEQLNRASDRFSDPDARVVLELTFVSGGCSAGAMSIHEPRRLRGVRTVFFLYRSRRLQVDLVLWQAYTKMYLARPLHQIGGIR
jgi:hypothetical protein